MLSYIYRLAKQYEDLHGSLPNTVYLNNTHFTMLKSQVDNPANIHEVFFNLGLGLILSASATHPAVGYIDRPHAYVAAS